MKIQIKHKITNVILFEHDCENNTIKITLETGIKKGAYLEGAYLEGANLGSANLEGANLEVKNPPLNDRIFISKILWRKAETEEQKDFAARILRETRCWVYFYGLAKKKQVFDWAEKILSQWKIYQNKIKLIRARSNGGICT